MNEITLLWFYTALVPFELTSLISISTEENYGTLRNADQVKLLARFFYFSPFDSLSYLKFDNLHEWRYLSCFIGYQGFPI